MYASTLSAYPQCFAGMQSISETGAAATLADWGHFERFCNIDEWSAIYILKMINTVEVIWKISRLIEVAVKCDGENHFSACPKVTVCRWSQHIYILPV